jgi:hypothetical protein
MGWAGGGLIPTPTPLKKTDTIPPYPYLFVSKSVAISGVARRVYCRKFDKLFQICYTIVVNEIGGHKMTIKEKLLEEFGAAIVAIYGDVAEKEYEEFSDDIEAGDINAIARKVKWYMELD